MLMNSVSNDDPATTSGVAIGRKISTLVTARPRNRWRPSAKAARVPIRVATSVASRPILTLTSSESHIPETLHGCAQA